MTTPDIATLTANVLAAREKLNEYLYDLKRGKIPAEIGTCQVPSFLAFGAVFSYPNATEAAQGTKDAMTITPTNYRVAATEYALIDERTQEQAGYSQHLLATAHALDGVLEQRQVASVCSDTVVVTREYLDDDDEDTYEWMRYATGSTWVDITDDGVPLLPASR